MVHAEIKILPIFGKTLDSRDEAVKLFDEIREYCPQCGEIVIDFSEVDFMSRSFADQFHKEKMEWVDKSQVVLVIKNAPSQVTEILDAVSRTQKTKVYKRAMPTSILSFTKKEPLFVYLKAI